MLMPWVGGLVGVAVTAWRDDANAGGHADAIVVLGAAHYGGRPSPVLKARLDHAVDLWRRGVAPRLVLTGGVGSGDVMSEAAASRRYVLRLGVPDSALVLEHTGRTTRESLSNAADLLRAKGWRRVMLVSDPPHMWRTAILARRFGLDPQTSPARGTPADDTLGKALAYWFSESVKAPTAFVVVRAERD
jgi:uncharacterized SAM-binding protein YcdF (DUF218 family)